MNTNQSNHLTEVTEERLDRLVDGELSRDEYRELLAALDRESEGWRRCALAFLEAQAWQRELPAVRAEGFGGTAAESRATESNTPQSQPIGGGAGSVWSTWAGRLALAASWFLVFTMGAGTYQALFSDAASSSLSNSPRTTTRSGLAGSPKNDNSLASHNSGPSAGGSGRGSGGTHPSEWSELEFQIADPQGNVLDRFVMPVSESGSTPGSVASSEPTVPDELADAARALKFDLRTNRTWIPVRVQNGENLMVPLDHIELQPQPARLPY